jgi:intraflagellar transport protein 80
MRFKTSTLKEATHKELVSCVAWFSPDDVLSIADDGKILKWNLVSSETKELAELASDFHPTDCHFFPRSGNHGGAQVAGKGGKKGQQVSTGGGPNDIFVVTSAEGKLQLMSGKNGRIEKSVDAHRGACLSARSTNNCHFFVNKSRNFFIFTAQVEP